MRACVFVDDSNDEQAAIPHETDTGELRALEKERIASISCIHTDSTYAWKCVCEDVSDRAWYRRRREREGRGIQDII